MFSEHCQLSKKQGVHLKGRMKAFLIWSVRGHIQHTDEPAILIFNVYMSVTNQTSLFSNFKLLFLWSSSTAYYTNISRWGLIWWCKRQLNYSFDYVCAQTSILRMKPWLIFPPKALAFTYCHKSKNDERQLGLETVRFPEIFFFRYPWDTWADHYIQIPCVHYEFNTRSYNRAALLKSERKASPLSKWNP